MLINTLAWAKTQVNLKRFIFASTSEVYAGTLKHFTMPIPTPEKIPLAIPDVSHPRTSYLLSKIYGEALCHHSGLSFTIIRPHNIYGARMGLSHVIPELLKKAYSTEVGKNLDVFSVSHKRTFCHIDDAVNIIQLLAESSDTINETYNIGSQDPEITIKSLAEIIMKIVDKKLTIIPQQQTSGSVTRRSPDMTKTINATGYRLKVVLKEGIKLTYDWYLKNVFSGVGVSAR
jgi:nucleoside-diphosphate-sugar epimerase